MATVVAGRFEDLIAKGLEVVIGNDPDLDLVARDVPLSEIASVAAKHSPAVVLINYGALGGPLDVQALTQEVPDARILVLATRPTAAECTQMLSFGATGCLSKDTEARDIVNAIHLASRGMHVLPRSAAATDQPEEIGIPAPDLLTAREADVLELLQQGMTNAQIAHELSIGVETVRTHARNIYSKLGISTRRDLARIARPGAGREPVGAARR
jgi:DNA-binding NarL/FixJ family response regulator